MNADGACMKAGRSASEDLRFHQLLTPASHILTSIRSHRDISTYSCFTTLTPHIMSDPTPDDEFLAYCIGDAPREVHYTAEYSAILGSLVPVFLAVVLLSTPRLRAQWSFRILTFALIIYILRCGLVDRVRFGWSLLGHPATDPTANCLALTGHRSCN